MKLSNSIIHITFKTTVSVIRFFKNPNASRQQIAELRELPAGTVGKEIATSLDEHNYDVVPGFESHDLKHIILDYKMTPIDEIRMQAFMIGNGNLALPTLAIFVYGLMLFPNKWRQLYHDFKLGLISKPIKHLTVEDVKNENAVDYRKTIIGVNQENESIFFAKLLGMASLGSIGAGVLGMLISVPFLFSAYVEDLIGAGFAFLAAAVLFAAGLISLTVLGNKVKLKELLA